MTAAGEDTDAFVAKLNGTDGSRLWGWQRGSMGNDYANAVAVDSSGDVYACGAASLGLFDESDAGAPPATTEGEGAGGGGAAAGSREDGLLGGGVAAFGAADVFVAKV